MVKETTLMKEPWKILLVEDDEDDYILTRKMLSEARGGQFILQWASSYEQALQMIENTPPDAILVDYDLGTTNGLELVRELLRNDCRAPMILVTGRGNYAVDVEAMKAGAADYLSKNEVNAPLLERTIRYAIERKQAEAELRRANEQLAEAKDELEIRVAERTLELKLANQELQTENAERRRVEAQNRKYTARIETLAELSQLLAGAVHDYPLVLDTIARQVAQLIGDATVITLLSDDQQWLSTVYIHHPDPEKAALLRDALIARSQPVYEGLRAQVVQTGQPILIPYISDDQFRALVKPEFWPFLEKYHYHSLLIVPLSIQGRVIGTLGIGRDKPENPYTYDDQVFLEDLANRAAMAITNAKLLQAMQNELTERKRMEAELTEIQRRLIESIEAERLQLAQELHDGPMQDLYGLTYQIDSLREVTPGEEGNTAITSFQTRLQQVIQTLRSIAGELRPPSLTPFGLEKAIRSHAEHFQDTQPNLHIQLSLMPDGQSLPEQVRLALFRIYQVALINVVRHARATRVVVRLNLNGRSVSLEIQDDGCGFNVPQRRIELARQGHLGLIGAAERAEAVGGSLKVESRPGQGTLIRVNVPY